MELRRKRISAWSVLASLLICPAAATAEPLQEAEGAMAKGDYETAVTKANEAIEANDWKEGPRILQISALMAQGKYEKAHEATVKALQKLNQGVQVRLAASEVFHYHGDANRSIAVLAEINQLAGLRGWAYRNAPDLVALGRTALKLGGDPKLILDNLYRVARESDPDYLGVPLAIGELALSKSDFELAGKTFQLAIRKHPGNAKLHFGAARAFAPSDHLAMMGHLQAALAANPNHAPSRILLANHLIDREAYAEAEEQLAKALEVNPHHPEAWAYRSIIAHLLEKKKREQEARANALAHWKDNPLVDYLIGRKLSQRYRFAEGAEHQRQALIFDGGFQPAKIQLAQDLLRLGEEEEGWKLTETAHEVDGYDVTTFNLVNLKDTLAKYDTMQNDHFVLRMAPHEAAVYGARAMRLLERAHDALTEKYGLKLEKPTIVEIFDKQKDFGVRTFGMPENPGYLGVCFGCVITANSPATQMPAPANWEAVLWHEFCHTVTLTLTKNKMPRWLSEGISVFEERQANPTWGHRMNPRFREMILEGELVPVGKLSGAFLAPKSGQHLQFAYYQSSLVVEHLVERFGHESIRSILEKLGQGIEINEAIAQAVEPMDKLEVAFAAYAKARAEALGPNLDWTRPDPANPSEPEEPADPEEPKTAAAEETADRNGSTKEPPPNFHVLNQEALRLAKAREWEAVKEPCTELIQLYPEYKDRGSNPYALLAKAYRELKEFSEERKTLESLAKISSDDYDTFVRLIELGEEAEDWESVRLNAERALAVNPLLPLPYRQLALAAEARNQTTPAIESWLTLLQLNPEDPAEAHFRLARLLRENEKTEAKRHLLMALEEAPRFRQAHRLLLDWNNEKTDDQ